MHLKNGFVMSAGNLYYSKRLNKDIPLHIKKGTNTYTWDEQYGVYWRNGVVDAYVSPEDVLLIQKEEGRERKH